MPSGEKTTEQTKLLWPSRVCRQPPLPVSQIRMVLSLDPEAMQVPSGEKTTEQAELLWPSRVWRQAPHVKFMADFAVAHFGSSSRKRSRVKLPLGLNISAE